MRYLSNWRSNGLLVSGTTVALVALAGLAPGRGAEPVCAPGAAMGQAGGVSFVRDIAPMFATTGCLATTCHGATNPDTDYSQVSYQSMFVPGAEARFHSICEIVPGNPDASYLLQKLTLDTPLEGLRMPNGLTPLTASQIDLVRRWIQEGAVEDTPPSTCPTGVAMGQQGGVSFVRDIAPMFNSTGCLAAACHGATNPDTDYSQLTYQSMFAPGAEARFHSICEIVPGDPDASYLLQKLTLDTPLEGTRMPNGLAPLSASQIDLVRRWIQEGAVQDTPGLFFERGEANNDGAVDLTDAINVLGFLFLGSPTTLPCAKAGDTDDNGVLEITDAVNLLGYLYLGSPLTLPQPFPNCGPDVISDQLDCQASQCQ